MVAVMLAGVMFPLWPPIMRLGVWYLSIGVLGLIGLFFAIAIVRLIFYIITVIVASPGIWIFPKLFADVGFVSCSFSFLFLSIFLFSLFSFHARFPPISFLSLSCVLDIRVLLNGVY